MIESDDYEPEDYIQRAGAGGPAIQPTQAKDMMGITGVIVRDYAENGMTDQLRHDYGVNEDEAWLSLKCADLATLPAWDAEALLDAATAYLTHGREMAARYGYTIEGNIPEGVERVKRRIRLAMLAEKTPDVMSPLDGVLLLRRAGIDVFHELLDAVAAIQLDSDDWQHNYRLLKGLAEPKQTVPSTCIAPAQNTATPALVVAGNEPVPARKRPSKRRTWRDVAMPYVVETYRAGKYKTAHVFYVALVNKAGLENSPFTLHDRELFMTDIGKSLAEKTIENAMPEIKAAARQA